MFNNYFLMKFAVCAFFILLVIVACGPGNLPPSSVPVSSAILPLDPDVRTGVLDNGLTWFVEPNGYPKGRVEMRLVVDVGSIVEDADQGGVAHYVEHMAFNGSEHFPGNEVVLWLESVGTTFGPHVNAYTSFNETVYKLSLSTENSKNINKGLLVMRDWAGGLNLDKKQFEDERGVVIEEWRGSQGAAFRKGLVTVQNLYSGSRYRERLPLGSEESLQNLTVEQLRRFYADWYRPELMTVLVTGDINPDTIIGQIKQHFGDLRNVEEPRERIRYSVPDHDEMLVSLYADPEEQAEVITLMSKVDLNWGDDETWLREHIVEQLAYSILGLRVNRLQNEPNAPLLGGVISRSTLTATRQVQVVSAQSHSGRSLEALEVLLVELHRAQTHGVSPDELDRAKSRMLRQTHTRYRERHSTHHATEINEAVRHVLVGEWMAGQAFELESLKRILPTIHMVDLHRWIKGFLPQQSRFVSVSMPDPALLPNEVDLRATIKRAFATDVAPFDDFDLSEPLVKAEPEAGRVIIREEFSSLGITHWTLSNGAEVWLKPTRFKQDEIYIRSWGSGGHSLADDADFYAAYTASALTNRSGAGPFSNNALTEYVSDLRLGMAAYVNENFHGINGWAAPADLETALTLLHLGFTAPRFDDVAFGVEVASRKERLLKRKNAPGARLQDVINEVRYANHLRDRAWTVEDLESMDLQTSKKFLEARFEDAGNFNFLFVGAFEVAEIEPLISTWIGSLPSVEREENWRPTGRKNQPGPVQRNIVAGLEPKADVRMWISGDTPYGIVSSHRAFMLSQVLQTILRERLREDLGGTYSVSVSTHTWYIPKGGYRFQVSFGCDPLRVDELTGVVLEVLQSAVDEPLEARVIDGIIAQMHSARDSDLQSNGAWTRWIQGYLKSGWDLADILNYEERLEGDTPDALHATARHLLKMDEVFIVNRLPEQAEQTGQVAAGSE